MIKMTVNEIADRYTICRLKRERTKEDMKEEFDLYFNELMKYPIKIFGFTDRLYAINGKIWDLEASLRNGNEYELGLEEVGRRAIAIRDLNRERIAIKNEMVEEYQEGFKDIKVNHGSEIKEEE